jgi:hypothetical protein
LRAGVALSKTDFTGATIHEINLPDASSRGFTAEQFYSLPRQRSASGQHWRSRQRQLDICFLKPPFDVVAVLLAEVQEPYGRGLSVLEF